MQQSLEIIRRRIDEVGTREPTIQRQGSDRILIQVPGIGSAAELKEIIGTTAQLTFQPVVGADPMRTRGRCRQRGPALARRGGSHYMLEQAPVVTGEELVDAQPSFRPERPAGGQFPLQPVGRAQVRRLYRREHRQPLRHRARRRGDLGPGDPEPHSRRLGHHHRQFHGRGIDATSPCCCAPARCPQGSNSSRNAPSAPSSGRTASRRDRSPRSLPSSRC